MATTPAPSDPIDPTDLAGIHSRALEWSGGRTAVRPLGIREIIIAEDAVEQLAAVTRRLAAGAGKAMLVFDCTPMLRGSEDLKDALQRVLGAALQLHVRQLGAPHQHLDATVPRARDLAAELDACNVVIALGSGTVTDIVKYARHLHEGAGTHTLPMVSFPTAASVTAYTSALAVIEVDGVKRTLPARVPEGVVCDLRTLADAPAAMSRAGFADVLARSVSYGDWFLADQLGMAAGFNDIPARLLAATEQRLITEAASLGEGRIATVRTLTEAVLLAGMAMSVVNQTAPLSGWEHVISHALDLQAAAAGRHGALHGAQVGIGTLLSAAAYERGWPALDLQCLPRAGEVDREATRARIQRCLAALDPRGRLIAEILRDLERKWSDWEHAAAARQRFLARHGSGDIDAFLQRHVRALAEVRAALRAAGAPCRLAELDVTVEASALRQALSWGHLIRARFTLGDLLDVCGWLSEDSIDGLLEDTGVLDPIRARGPSESAEGDERS